MFDFLRTFACESLSRIEASQLENNITKQRDKGATRYQKETDFHWLNKQSKFVRIRLKCVLNSQEFGMQNLQIAFVLRIAIEVEMGLYDLTVRRGTSRDISLRHRSVSTLFSREKLSNQMMRSDWLIKPS